MKRFFLKSLPALVLAVLACICLCCSPCNALELECEFVSTQLIVIRSSRPVEIGQADIPIKKIGRWEKENALKRNPDGSISKIPEITCYTYVYLQNPVAGQTALNINISGKKVTVEYNSEKASPLFKLNQLGNPPGQKEKYAYIGLWCGDAGALPLKHLAGKSFEIRSVPDNKTVFKNTLKLRNSDPQYHNSIPFTGEEVLELDYSSFNTPGRYCFYVDGIGRSMEFAIDNNTVNEAFYIHARGLFHKRCGIAKSMPYTAWESPACHRKVFAGRFPGNDADYRKGKTTAQGFVRNSERLEVKHFDLIKRNILPVSQQKEYSAPGGWHDAADYDRRPFHLRIVSDLATVYLMKPENFIDGQLNIPESGNGIPDILDEAAWGVKHLLAVQQDNGGVGTWFETTGHPQHGEGLPDKDKYTYYISAPSRNGTLEFAAAAGTLALAMKNAGMTAEAAKYLDSAQKAWNFAIDRKNILATGYMYNGKWIYYRENMKLDAGTLLKTAATLFAVTGEKKYLTPVLNEQKRIMDALGKDFHKWSPLSLMVLELYPVPELAIFRNEYSKIIISNADKMLKAQESAYPYRTLWRAPDDGWVHAMAWGNYHPLRRAMILIAAHKLTGQARYSAGAYLANDFHNGANPLGRTMTSGLGKIYPVVFLDLVSYADNIGEFVPGITPYGNTFGIDRNAIKLIYRNRADQLPIWHRYVNLEFLSVPSSEYSVWETIAPAAVVSGYLIDKPQLPTEKWKQQKPAADFRKLPGYRALP